MSTDEGRGEDSGIREFLGEYWAATPGCYAGVALAVLGALLAGVGVVTDSRLTLSAGVGAFVLGSLVVLVGCRLTRRQQQYLDRAERERLEVRSYLRFLDEVDGPLRTGDAVDAEADAPAEGERGRTAGPPRLWELRSRLELAEENLREARYAVYRRDYASFLSLFYEASRQEILLYDLLDVHTDGWAFGMGALGGTVDAPDAPDAVGATGPAPHRRRNLSRRIRSFAAESLPERRLALVREYLGEGDALPSPWELYYAVRVLHEWNVSRYERALQVKRFLRGGIIALSLVLVGLGVVLPLAFPEGILGTLDAADDLGTTDAFLVLVAFAGALGAVFSMLLRSFGDFYTLTTDPTVPEPVFMMEALVARTLFGGVSALVLFFVARTDLASVVFTQDLLTSPLSLLLLGFVAGLSERLVQGSLGRVVERMVASEAESTRTGASDSPGRTVPRAETGTADGSRPTGHTTTWNEPDEDAASDRDADTTGGEPSDADEGDGPADADRPDDDGDPSSRSS
jgi:hypothetical protein